ncbi:MAG: alpha-galactosidase [Micropruina sp.]|uniref:alpha-galactosidase n=1 Tax=Micropruina sp. TaxID=2737536 RepID=UPI0039E2A2EB
MTTADLGLARPEPDACVVLRAAGVCVVLDIAAGRLPAIVHWGADLGDLTDSDVRALVRASVPPVVSQLPDQPLRLAVLPEHWTGWVGRPGLRGSRHGRDWSPQFRATALRVDGADVVTGLAVTGAGSVQLDAVDDTAGLGLTLTMELLASGLFRSRARLTNLAGDPYQLDDLVLAYPVPQLATEILDLTGRWTKERVPQRRAFTVGTHLRENRKGHTGHDSAYLLHAGAAGFGFGTGEIWSVHTAWSGNHTHYAERMYTGEQVIGGGELLLPGEIVLGPGDRYTSPWLYGSYGIGLDTVARRFHSFLRERPHHPSVERPVTLNVWEAVYFDHDLTKLIALAEAAAAVGVERFVLDDGWFGARRDDHAGLGDWTVSPEVWPNGLHPLIDRVNELGMQFGLWFEPEMINPDSDAARAHPEWIMATGGRRPVESRYQQVINLGIPACYGYIRDAMTALLDEYPIAYVKWDHNRDLIDAGTAPSGRPGVHEQTLAYYRLVDELKAAHPGLEIESCSSGGARVDIEAIQHTDRIWVSDCIDPLERQQMNRWTQQLLPPELLGSHIASGASHTTGRSHTLNFRAATAVFGHLGIEWDLTRASAAELVELGAWVGFYKEYRSLLLGGEMIRIDLPDDTIAAHGVIAPDRSRAVYSFAELGRSPLVMRGRLRFPGLDAERRYWVAPLMLDHAPMVEVPQWWGVEQENSHAHYPSEILPRLRATPDFGVELTGAALAQVGLTHAPTFPETAILYLAEAVDRDPLDDCSGGRIKPSCSHDGQCR